MPRQQPEVCARERGVPDFLLAKYFVGCSCMFVALVFSLHCQEIYFMSFSNVHLPCVAGAPCPRRFVITVDVGGKRSRQVSIRRRLGQRLPAQQRDGSLPPSSWKVRTHTLPKYRSVQYSPCLPLLLNKGCYNSCRMLTSRIVKGRGSNLVVVCRLSSNGAQLFTKW